MFGESARPRGILFVCTGNVCRSPYAERRLRQLLPDIGVPVSSAGTEAVVGSGIEPETADLLLSLGATTRGFAARAVTPELVDGAELVLTLTRAHRGEVARLEPGAMRRIFALGDFADLCRASHTWRPLDPERAWLPQVVAEAAASRGTLAPREATDVDVVDPYGRSTRTLLDSCDRIEQHLAAVVAVLGAAADRSHVAAAG